MTKKRKYAKNRRRKQAARIHGATPVSHTEHRPSNTSGSDDVSLRDELMQRMAAARDNAAPDDPDAVLALLARIWPQQPELAQQPDQPAQQPDQLAQQSAHARADQAARMAWLLMHWPARAMHELKALSEPARPTALVDEDAPDRLLSDELLEVLASAVLLLGPEHVDAMCSAASLGEEFMHQARRVRAASEHIAGGHADAGVAELNAIGLRSPFRAARMFLRGLAAYYEHDDERAVKALERVKHDACLGSAAVQLIGACTTGSTDHAASALDPRVAALLGRADEVALARVVSLIRARKCNAALREASRHEALAGPLWRDALMHDLTAALFRAGMNARATATRMCRAFSNKWFNLHSAHLEALLHQGADTESSHWLTVARLMARGDGDLLPAQRARAQAEFLARAAREILLDAREEDDMEIDDYIPGHLRSAIRTNAGELRARAVALMEQAVDLAPDNQALWAQLVEATSETGDARARHRVIERMVKAFPDDARTLITAARGAAERKSWDKALRHVRRAVAMEPMNRDARTTEARLLCGKARTLVGRSDFSKAEKLYQAAVEVPHCTRDGRLEIMAEAAAFYQVNKESPRARDVCAQALQRDPRPWIWTAFYVRALEALGNDTSRQKRAGKKARIAGKEDRSANVFEQLTSAPSRDELLFLLGRADAHHEATSQGALFMQTALAQGYQHLTSEDELFHAMGVAEPWLSLRMAEHGRALFPHDLRFLVAAYQIALFLNKPVEYFRTAGSELHAAVHRLGQPLDLDDPGVIYEVLGADLEFEVTRALFAAVMLWRQIKAHMAGESPWSPTALMGPGDPDVLNDIILHGAAAAPGPRRKRGRDKDHEQTELLF